MAALVLMAVVFVVAWIVPWVAYRDANTEAPEAERRWLHSYIGTMKVRPLYTQVLEARMGEANPGCVEGHAVARTLFGVKVADLEYRCVGENEGYQDFARAVRAWLAFLGIEGVLASVVAYTVLVAPRYDWDETGLPRARIASFGIVAVFCGLLGWAWMSTL